MCLKHKRFITFRIERTRRRTWMVHKQVKFGSPGLREEQSNTLSTLPGQTLYLIFVSNVA